MEKRAMCIADERIVFRMPDDTAYCYTPAIQYGGGNRLIASFDLAGPGLRRLFSPPYTCWGDYDGNQLHVMISDDMGGTWRRTAVLPMLHASLFRASGVLYLLGHAGFLCISRSVDNGESWSEPVVLEKTRNYHQSNCNVEIVDGRIYAAYEYRLPAGESGSWPNVMPLLMSADENADLLDAANWTFSSELPLEMILGVPSPGAEHKIPYILETNVIALRDRRHVFYEEGGINLLLVMRTTYEFCGTGAVLRGRRGVDGSLSLDYLRREDSSILFFFPLPGGNMKFFMQYDEKSGHYWMIASQNYDYYLEGSNERPDGPRQRLALYFSRDALNWCFAGLVAKVSGARSSRHYASFAIAGEDLYVLARSGDEKAASRHNGNLITLHTVREFRRLLY